MPDAVKSEPFAELDGAIWWPSGEDHAWVLRVGRYEREDGPVAIWVETDAGETIDTLTVNLEAEAVAPGYGRFHVKTHGYGRDQFLLAVALTELVEVDATRPKTAAGWVIQYAEVWRLKGDAEHRRIRREVLAARAQEERDVRVARDAAKRLGARGVLQDMVAGED